jgi:predicted NBD/HSP70 family sugar kinase
MIAQKRARHDHIVGINSKVGRNINRAAILNFIRERQPISRAMIAEITRLNKSTVSSIVSGLLEENLVTEERKRNHRIGRTPINLRIKSGKHCVGAMYIDSSKTSIAIVDVDGSVKRLEETPTEAMPPTEFITRCLEKLSTLRKQTHLPPLKSIGVTIAGIVDPAQATVIYAPNLGWADVALGETIHNYAPQLSVTIENDARASALAELWFGKHHLQPTNFVFLAVGAGIGTGIVIDNHILGGSSHAAGEFGHMTIVEGGEPCSCGNLGCWEVYASDRATVRRYIALQQAQSPQTPSPTLSDIITSARRGDPTASGALLKTSQYLGLGIANIVRSFDPEVVVIGGLITQAWELIYPEIMETVNRRGFLGKARNIRILPTSLSTSPPLLGAAALPIRKLFTDYRIAI